MGDRKELPIIPPEKEYTMSAEKANLYALLLFVPVIIFMIVPYFLLYPVDKNALLVQIKGLGSLYLLLSILAGVMVHELIHGLFLGMFAASGYKSISFGIHWKMLTPYCHCNEPLTARHYRIGLMMPLVLLGIVPFIIAMIGGHMGIFLFSIIFTLGAGGDILIFWLMRKLSSHTMVKDHPEKIGFYII